VLDEFAKKLGYSRDLAHSLIKLQIQNLSTMDTDWMYGAYHFSHPILAERLGALGWYGEKAKSEKDAKTTKEGDEVVKAADREL
jgi:STE24 endopeptidase